MSCTDTLERYAARTALRRESIEDSHRRGSEDDHDQTSRVSMEMNVRQLETLDRASKEKKTSSKIKKFFKKLSSHKKESSKQDDVIDHLSVTSRHDLRLPSSTDSEHSGGSSIGGDNRRFSGNYSSSPNIFSVSRGGGTDNRLRLRRSSEGTISLYSVSNNDSAAATTTNYLTQATPSTKRRLFAINLSFMKRGRRQQQHNNNSNNSTTVKNDVFRTTSSITTTEKPSETVRALCSPYATRRNRLALDKTDTAQTTALPAPLPLSNGRRASESTVYRITHQRNGLSNSSANANNGALPGFLQRHNTSTTATLKQKQQQQLSNNISTSTPYKRKLTQQHSLPTTMNSISTSLNYHSNTNHRTQQKQQQQHELLLTSSTAKTNNPYHQQVTPDYAALDFSIPPSLRMGGRLNSSSLSSRRSSLSTSSNGDEADYINYPFSKSNVCAPQKPTRTASNGSKGNTQ